MNTAKNDEPIEFIKLPAVKAMTGISTANIYKLASKGRFPKQVNLGGRSVAWIKAEVIAWNRAQVAAARADCASEWTLPIAQLKTR